MDDWFEKQAEICRYSTHSKNLVVLWLSPYCFLNSATCKEDAAKKHTIIHELWGLAAPRFLKL